MRPLFDRQGAVVLPSATLTGRHRAPNGAPARAKTRVGGEGTTSRAVVVHLVGAPARPVISSQPRQPAGAPRA